MDLIKCISESNSYHGWTHKDLIKLIHCKTDNQAIEVIIKYILYGKAKAVEAAGDDPEAAKVLNFAQEMKEYKTSGDAQKVWTALIPQLSLSELIASLPKLYKMSFLKAGPLQTKIIDILCNNEIVRASNLHPAEIYIGLKNLEKGGKPKDPHLIKYLESKEDVDAKILADPDYKKPNFAHQEPAKCTPVINAVQKALTTSYANLKPVNKRIMITIDVGDKMNDPCLTTKNVTCLEAAIFIAYCVFKSNKIVTVAVFDGTTITPVPVEKNIALGLFHKKIKEAKHGPVIWSAPFEWAANERKQFDVFVHMGYRPNIIDLSKELREIDKPKEAFGSYMQKLSIPYARFIVCSLGIHNAYFSGDVTNILDVCGFDKNVPNIIDAFCKNLF
ncbi:60 kda ribonucleoprotein ssa/ro [Holotrichia oblita]|uniref:60 kDa ribonucleoprotein ssa/ro n=1 Tax=Holotrichia oblita TaxID=644536 RepID=A0ACB9SWL7_HOLOL|nr:60 kda ribonucleoprotein ssa/ro [Holotrichia oblita]